METSLIDDSLAPRPGFEPGSQPRQGCMIGHYTIGAGIHPKANLYIIGLLH